MYLGDWRLGSWEETVKACRGSGSRGYIGPRQTNPDLWGFSRVPSNMTFAGEPVRTGADLYAARFWNNFGEPHRQVRLTQGGSPGTWFWARLFGVVPNTWTSLAGWIEAINMGRSRPASVQAWYDKIRELQKCIKAKAGYDEYEGPYGGWVFPVHLTDFLPCARAGVFEELGCPLPAPIVGSHPGDYSGPAMPVLTGRPSKDTTAPKEETTTEATPEEEPEEGQGGTGREPGVVHDPDEPEETVPTESLPELEPPPESPTGCADGYTWDADIEQCVPVGGPTDGDPTDGAPPQTTEEGDGFPWWWLLVAGGAYVIAKRRGR